MSSDWDKELAKIDKQLESVSDEQLFPSQKAAAPKARADIAVKQRTTSTLGVMTRLLLAVALGIAMLFWPYGARCGVGLFGYLAASLVVTAGGVWSGVWTWRHRAARAHVLSLMLVMWGLVLGAREVLPRIGYAQPDPARPSTWVCQ